MRTFLLNEVFQPNRNCRLSKLSVADVVPAVICDDTLADLDRVRALVHSSPASNWKHKPGGKNFVDYKDCRVRYPVMAPLDLWQLTINIVREAYGKKPSRRSTTSTSIVSFRLNNAGPTLRLCTTIPTPTRSCLLA